MGIRESLIRWIDSYQGGLSDEDSDSEVRKLSRNDLVRCIPFIGIHLGAMAVIWVGVSPVAVGLATLAYVVRMFAVTGFYHRYFSHCAFKTSRPVQFIFAAVGATSVQRGALWWAAHHRHHHRHSDEPADIHSPGRTGFWWSHVLWLMSEHHFRTRTKLVRDWAKFPELVFLDRFDILIPLVFAVATFALGEFLAFTAPQLGTNGWQMFVWMFVISTVVLYHCTFTINSLAHKWGSKRFKRSDESRNNWFLAILTLGEGWHNNHHHYPHSARQGFYWWEIDITYSILWIMSKLGLIWDLKPVPQRVLVQGRQAFHNDSEAGKASRKDTNR